MSAACDLTTMVAGKTHSLSMIRVGYKLATVSRLRRDYHSDREVFSRRDVMIGAMPRTFASRMQRPNGGANGSYREAFVNDHMLPGQEPAPCVLGQAKSAVGRLRAIGDMGSIIEPRLGFVVFWP